jgi:hypothetical protein
MDVKQSMDIIIHDIHALSLCDKHKHEIFDRGAYTLILDNGRHYKKWVRLHGVRKSDSSHKGGPSFRLHNFLMALTERGTFFQFEGHSLDTPLDWTLHQLDWVYYVFTNRNVGPKGTSRHTENNDPIYIVVKSNV